LLQLIHSRCDIKLAWKRTRRTIRFADGDCYRSKEPVHVFNDFTFPIFSRSDFLRGNGATIFF
jgi:hypothetical protein